MANPVRIGIIGGSGVYQMESLTDVEEVKVKTPFGDPSDAIVVGTLAGPAGLFAPPRARPPHHAHRGERSRQYLCPQDAGRRAHRSVSAPAAACGRTCAPRDIVIPNQLFDHTRGAPDTFFGNGLVVHVGVADPFCPDLSDLVVQSGPSKPAPPSTGAAPSSLSKDRASPPRPRSNIYRTWGMSIIGMTALPEAHLAREAEICYAVMAHVTDYDVWHVTEAPVTVEMVIDNLRANAAVTKEAIANLAPIVPVQRTCECASALSTSIITQLDLIPGKIKKDLAPLLGKYVHSGRSPAPTMFSRLRLTELALLLFPAALAAAGLALLSFVQRNAPPDAAALRPAAVFAGALALVWLALVVTRCRADQALLPIALTLTALGAVMVRRLDPAVADRQLNWFLIGIAAMLATVALLRDLEVLRRYRYLWALAGLALVTATLFFGVDTGGTGARLWLAFGGGQFQPSELLKILLVVYLASYLAENQEILAAGTYRLGPLRLPPLAHLAPLVVMLGISLLLLAGQRDLGAALLFFGIYLAMLYMASGQIGYVLAGLVPFLAGSWLAVRALPYVAARVEVWMDPFSRAQANGYQIVQALIAMAAGGVFGVGLGYGYPGYIPAVQSDYIIAAIAEELGMAGTMAVIALYMALVGRGFAIALRARDPFARLLAAGLSTVLGLQSLIILAGSFKIIPLTGITLPFVSYGGSSLVTNFIIIGILLRVSDLQAAREERP